MKLQSMFLRTPVFVSFMLLFLGAPRLGAQNKKEALTTSAAKSEGLATRKPVPRDNARLEAAQEGPEFLRRRQDWFFKPRAFPIGFIPQGARERALQQRILMYQREGRLSLFAAPEQTGFLTPPLGPTSAWLPAGPQPTSTTLFDGSLFGGATSGRVTALVVNPNNANNVFLGGADGGLWVTTNSGTNWTSLTDNPANSGIPTIAVGSLAVDPTTCGPSVCTTVYVGTGEENFGAENVYGEGVLKCAVAAGPPPSAACTQDNTFHFSNNLPLSSVRGGPSIGALAVNPAAGKQNILLAAVRGLGGSPLPSGIWCSADSGVNWARVLPTSTSASDPGTDVAFAADGTAWVALGNPFGDAANNGIYKSSAAVSSCTITFTKQTLPAALSSNIGRITLAIFPSSSSTGGNATIYTAVADSSTTSSNLLGVAKTTNGGSTWTQLSSDARLLPAHGVCNSQCFYDILLAVSPASAGDVFFGGAAGNGTLIRSTDGGNTWTEISRNNIVPFPTDSIHVDMHAMAFSSNGSTMYVGNDGGTWKAASPLGSPAAGFWTNLNQNLQITQFYPGVSIHPSNSGFAMAGAQDNGIEDYQGFAGNSLLWQDSGLGCDGGFTAIDFSIPSTAYGECEYLPNAILLIATSFNNGDLVNGFLATNGINGGDRGAFIPPLVMDPSNSSTLYFGTCRVYKTTDGGQNWTSISPDVTSMSASHPADCSNQAGGTLSTIAIAKASSNVIYAGSDNGDVEVTADGGTTWTSLFNSLTLPQRAITQIVVEPSSASGDIAYVTFSGFATCANSAITCDSSKGHVFKTLNGTAGATTTWVDISHSPFSITPLPDIPVNALVLDPDDNAHNTIYVGTDIGAFFTADGGVNWSPLGAASSLPNAQILSLTLHNPSRTLRAAMHGRGVWDLSLGPGPNTPAFEISKLSPFSASAPGATTTLTVTGTGFTGSSTVMWGSTVLTPTTFVSPTQLTASIPASDLSAGALVQVTVHDSTQTPNTTNALPFTVLGPAPTIASVSPTSAPVNSAATTITVTGTNFNPSAKVLMNSDLGGTAITTTFLSPTQLTAMVPASFMASFGSTNSVGVQNPPPGGGITVTTQTVTLPTFIVRAPAPTNDNFANAISITSTNFTDTKDSSGATTETGDPQPPCSQIEVAGSGRANTIWYKVVPSRSGTANIDTIGSSYDSVLSVWAGTSQTSLSAVPNGCNDDINSGIVLQSQITNLTLNAGTTYYIMVSSFGPANPNPIAFGGKSVLNFSFTGTLGGGTVATTTTATSSSTSIKSGGSVTLTATVVGTGTGASPTGTVQFMNGSAALGTPQTCSAVSGATSPTCKATLTTTLAFLAPPTGPNRVPTIRVPWTLFASLTLLLLLLLNLKRVPASYRRVYACVALLLLAGLVAGLAVGCSSGYGGGGGGVHYDSITAVYSGDATYAGSTSPALTITVQ